MSRLAHTPYQNSPWAVVIAPASGFGGFSGDILVGQFGSGAIAAYTPAGSFVGLLFNPANLQLQIDGVWGHEFRQRHPVRSQDHRCTSLPGPSAKLTAYWETSPAAAPARPTLSKSNQPPNRGGPSALLFHLSREAGKVGAVPVLSPHFEPEPPPSFSWSLAGINPAPVS